MYQVISYIKFLLKSKNQHGVHSPFVYGLVTNCFYDRTNYTDYSSLKSYRKSLFDNSTVIEITDFGSGSKVFSSNNRSIKHIAKTSGTSLKRAKLLYRIVHHLKPKTVLELGTSLGISTHAMALAKAEATITSVEGCPQIGTVAREQLQRFQIENIILKSGRFSDVLPQLPKSSFDMIFFDGHHDKGATLRYFEQLLPTVHNDSMFIFDDIHWSKGMTEAWETIKQHPQVTVTIDTFYWGFVFFRKEQAKEHFYIRL